LYRLSAIVLGLFAILSSVAYGQAEPPPARPTSAAARHLERCLEQAGVKFDYIESGDFFGSRWGTGRWTNPDDKKSALVIVDPDDDGDVVAWLPSAYDLSLCDHLNACRRVMAESYWKAGAKAQFVFDPKDAEVRAVLRAPGQSGRIEPKVLRSMIEEVLNSVDSIDFTMRKAMDTGDIVWPSEDLGPKESTSDFKVTFEGFAESLDVGVAPWIEKEIFASTILAFDDFGRKLVQLNDEEAESFGVRLFEPYKDGWLAWAVYRDWSAFWRWVKGHYPPIAVRVWGPPGLIVTGTLRCDGYISKACDASVEIDQSGRSEIMFTPDWDQEKLMELPAPRSLPIRIAIEVPEGKMDPPKVEIEAAPKLQPCSMAQIDLPLALPIAMHINEMHPWIDGLLREAKRTGICASLGNFETTPRIEQVQQLFAVWKAFRDRGLSYSNIASASDAKIGQRVRALHECLNSEQANCIDGVTTMASVLRALDFDVHVIHVPGHTFLAVWLNDQERGAEPDGLPNLLAIETTMVGSEFTAEEVKELKLLDPVERAIKPSATTATDWRCFEMACFAGISALTDAVNEKSLRMIPVSLLRNCGLHPIPVVSSEIGPMPTAPKLETVIKERTRRDAAQDRARKESAKEAPQP